MNNKTQWIVYLVVVLAALLVGVLFSKSIWSWFERVYVDVVIYLLIFGAGWLLGRFSGRRCGGDNTHKVTEM